MNPKPQLQQFIQHKTIKMGTERVDVAGIDFHGYLAALEKYVTDLEEAINQLQANPAISLTLPTQDGKGQVKYEWMIHSDLNRETGKLASITLYANYYTSSPEYNQEAAEFLRKIPIQVDIEDSVAQEIRGKAI